MTNHKMECSICLENFVSNDLVAWAKDGGDPPPQSQSSSAADASASMNNNDDDDVGFRFLSSEPMERLSHH